MADNQNEVADGDARGNDQPVAHNAEDVAQPNLPPDGNALVNPQAVVAGEKLVALAAKKIKVCNGDKPDEVLTWLRAVTPARLPDALRLLLALDTSTGLLNEVVTAAAHHTHWPLIFNQIASELVAPDFAARQLQQLRYLRQLGALVSHNYEFRKLLGEAYPDEIPQDLAVKLYIGSLKKELSEAVVRQAHGYPDDVDAAIALALEEDRVMGLVSLTKDAAPAKVKVAPVGESLEDRVDKLTAELAKLRAASVLQSQPSATTNQPRRREGEPPRRYPPPRRPIAKPATEQVTSPDEVPPSTMTPRLHATSRDQCFRCRQMGHWQSECRAVPTTPCPGCGHRGHWWMECRLNPPPQRRPGTNYKHVQGN